MIGKLGLRELPALAAIGRSRLVRAGCALAVLTVLAGSGASSSLAAGSPWWHLSTRMFPSNLAPGGEATVVLLAVNVGDAPLLGTPTMKETFPAGITVQQVEFYPLLAGTIGKTDLAPQFCEQESGSARCTIPLPSFNLALTPFEDLEMRVTVKSEGSSESPSVMDGEISGGEAPRATIKQNIPVTATPPTFGVEHFTMVPEEEGGAVDVQAGSHPYQLTSTLTVNESADQTRPLAVTRNVAIKLPPGLVGNATRIPQCTDADFKASVQPGAGIAGTVDRCSPGAMVGVATITIDEPNNLGLTTLPVPIFNLVPERGEPARFGFEIAQSPVILDTSVRTGADYGVTVTTTNITELAAFISSNVTFWGAPGDQRHDEVRGWSCLIEGRWYAGGEAPPCVPEHQSEPTALLTLPTACEPFVAAAEGVSWPTQLAPGGLPLARTEYALKDEFGRELGLTGCGRLRFEPSLDVKPEVSRASSPTGLRVDLHMPEAADESASGLVGSAIKDLSVSLPQGVTINPASAGGLEACDESAVGYLAGQSAPPDDLRFSAFLPSGWEEGSGFCPTASKIGTVSIVSRLLPPGQPLDGDVYLAAQNANPFRSLLAMYIVATDPVSGVVVKLAGQVVPDPSTGQLVATFHNTPQLPFEDAILHFFGGQKAALTTPALCGTYRTLATLTPWSGAANAVTGSDFQITAGAHGGPCPPSRPFAPSLAVSPTNIRAGAFSSLTTTISRDDGDQDLQTLSLHMPPGLSGVLSGVKLCPQAAAEVGGCPADSLIGDSTVRAGVGTEPVTITGGKVYLTEAYAGAPFGLSISSPAKAGPFDLALEGDAAEKACDCIITRAKVEVDPHTAQLTVTTDPASGHHPIPRMLAGVPLQLRRIDVTINRPSFTFNPTSCEPFAVTGTASGYEGASASLTTPFQVANCALLKFTPTVTVKTAAHTTKANGASLSFRIAYPKGAMGSQSWFNEAKFEIPKQLPARLTTIQKACVAATFETNRGACLTASIIGHAVVHTPVLPVPLQGPVYFVSHGGAKFPDAVLVLDGYGIHIELRGETNIKNGVTSATFRNTPDVPFDAIEVTIPSGPFSEFGSNLPAKARGSFCGQKLVMPTLFKAQNGLEIRRNTKVAVTGCPKARKTRAQKLAAALRACKKKAKGKRAGCRRQAYKKYGRAKKKR